MESKPLLGLPFLNSKIALHSNANVALRKEQYDAPSNPLLAVLIVVPFSGLLFQSSASDTLGVDAQLASRRIGSMKYTLYTLYRLA